MSRMMPSSTSFFFFFLPEDANNTSKNCPKCPCSASSKLQINQPYSNHNSDIAIHRHRKENLLEHGLEHWRTRRRQRRGDKGRGVNGFNSEFPFPFKKLSTAEKLCICFTYFLMVCLVATSANQLDVHAKNRQVSGPIGSNVSLTCLSSVKPVLCLWKTPYSHVYTLSEGVFAESGRIRHKKLPQGPSTSDKQCGIEIIGVEDRDAGQWECEVGAVTGEDFKTATANIDLEIKVKPTKSKQFEPGEITQSRQEVGNDVILHCSANREVHLCRWKTPYLNTYIVGEGIYVERGRIQWLGSDPNYDCTIRVANLDLRDSGTWVCEIGSSTKESFQVQTKEFVIDIEKPLKLSAPTSLMQNANTDATLVCHANKPFDDCLWTTPYGKTYSFKPNDRSVSHENGRLAYFGFADTDCGVIVHNVQARDNGGWLCQLHSHNGGGIFQNATDIVPLFADSAATRLGAAQPRSIPDYDYDKSISLGGGRNTDKDQDFDNDDEDDRDFSGRVGTPAIDTFDYDNIDFDKVNKDIRKTTATDFDTSTKRPKITGQIRIDRVRPGSDQGAFTKIVGTPNPASITSKKPTRFRTSNVASNFATTEPSTRGSTLRDIFITSDGSPMNLELAKINPTSSSADRTTTSFGRGTFQSSEETSPANPLSIFGRKPTKSSDKDLRLTGVDPLELELLSRISGTHRDTRPLNINNRERTEQEMLKNIGFESSKTTVSSFEKHDSSKDQPEEPRKRMKVTNVNSGFTFPTEKDSFRVTTPSSSESREEMRLREIQRIRDERRRKAMERQKGAKHNVRKFDQKKKEEKTRKDQGNVFSRESEIARQKEKKRKEEIARRAETARRKESKRREELARKAEKEREAELARKADLDREAEIARREEAARIKEKERKEELARKEEKKQKEERARQDAIARRKEKERQEEVQRQQAKRRREEIARQKELRRQKEQEKQAEIARQKEIDRLEEIKRKEELDRKKEKERQEELARIAKIEEDRKQKLAELLRQEELAEKRRIEVAAQRKAEREEQERREFRAKQEKERKRKAEEERLRRLEEEEDRKRKLEEERKKKAEEERLQRLEEEERRRKLEIEKKKKAEEDRLRRIEEEERKIKLEAERRRKEEEERVRRIEEDERKRKIEAERKRQQEERKKFEARRREEAERKKEARERRRKEEKERKEKEERERIEREEQKKLDAERKQKEEEFKARLEKEKKRKEDAARRRAEVERRRQESRENRRREQERRKKEEEERLKKEVEQKRKWEEEQVRKEAQRKRKEENDRKAEEERIRKEIQEKRRKEKEENERIAAAKEDEVRNKRLQQRRDREERERRRKVEAEKQRKIEEERQRILDEENAKERLKKEQEELQLRRREQERQQALSRIREERLKLLQQKQEAEKVNRQIEKQVEQERSEFETKRKALEAERGIQDEIRQKAELEKQRRKEELERRRQEKEPPIEINRASLIPRTESPRQLLQSLPTTDVGDTKCYISPTPTNGNITCNGDITDDGQYIVSSGRSCILKCRQGFVSLSSREARCMTSGRLIGRWSRRLECVAPDAMIIIGGRNTNGVLSSVELVTGKGVCRGAVPPLPAMRWKMIAHTVDEDRVLACGGTNIFGEPKSNCWILGFRGRTPFWSQGPDMLTARDSAAWALEGDYLFAMGGSLGKLKGSTDEVEMYQVSTGRWVEGPSMSSRRHGHCSVGLGNGSLVVTGGYGGLRVAERFDLATGLWTPLAELSPVRAQHGCALVELHGEQGIMIVGGDSGGTRLRDVRFLPLNGPSQEWQKVADLNIARWGRPGVAIVGGRIAVAGGWDGSKDLDTVEYYDESQRDWKIASSRLQTERRWLASSPISIRLFPKCAQRRE